MQKKLTDLTPHRSYHLVMYINLMRRYIRDGEWDYYYDTLSMVKLQYGDVEDGLIQAMAEESTDPIQLECPF
jgi:hypothetical protein